MKNVIFTLIETFAEYDGNCDFGSDIISHHMTIESARKAFDKRKACLMGEDWGCKLINETTPYGQTEILYRNDFKNHCVNISLQIIKKEINED